MSAKIDMLTRVMDATALRQRVLADNLANANTPEFKRRDVVFRDLLTSAMRQPDGIKPDTKTMEIVVDRDSPSRPDGNNVSMQKELAEMMENGLLNQFAARAVSRSFDSLRKAIKGS
jgi:flagellar basal-body rod protein FlgB